MNYRIKPNKLDKNTINSPIRFWAVYVKPTGEFSGNKGINITRWYRDGEFFSYSLPNRKNLSDWFDVSLDEYNLAGLKDQTSLKFNFDPDFSNEEMNQLMHDFIDNGDAALESKGWEISEFELCICGPLIIDELDDDGNVIRENVDSEINISKEWLLQRSEIHYM